MTWIYTNIGSFFNKKEELELLIQNDLPDIVLIVESWLNDKIDSDLLSIQGYNLFMRKDRQKIKGGGLMGYFRLNSNVSIESIEVDENNEAENCWFKLSIDKFKFLVGLFYRPPNGNECINNEVIEVLNKGFNIFNSNFYNDIIIIGDFNLPLIDWINDINKYPKNSFGDRFYDFVSDNILIQNIREKTRFRNSSSSLIDLLINKKQDFIENINFIAPIGKSDHTVIKIDYNLEIKYEYWNINNRFINFKNANYENINIR